MMSALVPGVLGFDIQAFSSVRNLACLALCQDFSGEGILSDLVTSSHFKLTTVTRA